MCHLARHQQSPVVDAAEPAGSPPSTRIRPRWVAAAATAAAAVLAGFAAAALLDRPLAATAPVVEQAAAPGATVPITSTLVPVTSSTERGALAPDDGVPTSTETSKASLGDCHHGL